MTMPMRMAAAAKYGVSGVGNCMRIYAHLCIIWHEHLHRASVL
jgi:hypothetical protein